MTWQPGIACGKYMERACVVNYDLQCHRTKHGSQCLSPTHVAYFSSASNLGTSQNGVLKEEKIFQKFLTPYTPVLPETDHDQGTIKSEKKTNQEMCHPHFNKESGKKQKSMKRAWKKKIQPSNNPSLRERSDTEV